jgi:hypothetical protein
MPVIFTIVLILLLALIARFLIEDKKVRILFTVFILVMTGIVSANPLIIARLLLPISFVVLLTRVFDKKKFPVKNFLILFLPSFFGLLSFENFLYCEAILILYSIYLSVSNRSFFKLLIPLVPLVFSVVVSVFLSGGFDYLIHSLQTVSDYSCFVGLCLIFFCILVFF